jgi:hypothetical protein
MFFWMVVETVCNITKWCFIDLCNNREYTQMLGLILVFQYHNIHINFFFLTFLTFMSIEYPCNCFRFMLYQLCYDCVWSKIRIVWMSFIFWFNFFIEKMSTHKVFEKMSRYEKLMTLWSYFCAFISYIER